MTQTKFASHCNDDYRNYRLSLMVGLLDQSQQNRSRKQTKRISDLLDDKDLFSVYEKLTTDMIEGTVDY